MGENIIRASSTLREEDMETIKDWDMKLEVVKTRKGVLLHRITLSEDHFFLEQNPLKESKYGVAYRRIKEKYPEFYMFWEIKKGRYTGKLIAGAILDKEEIDLFITDILQSEEFKNYEDVREEIED
ncbi:hypothetical protein HG1285_12767 [Hydrogenivirga sp. 128-5-R1-1]|nr:hypothetical protein HG1285_12767 [Hydrogenivirga sp. 128-5-R1-1]